METIGTALKFIILAAALALVFGGIYFATLWNARYGLVAPGAQTAAAGAAPARGAVVTLTGSLSYYDQQGRSVPYLIYVNERGAAASKALAFRDESICVTSIEAPCPGNLHALIDQYGTGRVQVEGIVDDESLIVERLTAAS